MNRILRAGRTLTSLLAAAWLMIVQPGMSYYWLINPDVHTEIDAALYGQSPAGETLPGHVPHAPHQHPVGVGMNASDLALSAPFDAAVYHALAIAAQCPALHSRPNETAVFGRAIAIEPPLQPPRTSL